MSFGKNSAQYWLQSIVKGEEIGDKIAAVCQGATLVLLKSQGFHVNLHSTAIAAKYEIIGLQRVSQIWYEISYDFQALLPYQRSLHETIEKSEHFGHKWIDSW